MIIDSHFHAISMRKRLSEELPADLIGIDVGTDAGDAGERIALLPQSETIFFSIGSGPWALDSPGYLSPEAERERQRSLEQMRMLEQRRKERDRNAVNE